MAEYIRRLVRRDLERPAAASPDVTGLFGLGDSGGSDVARRKDEYMADAIGERHRR